jgi:AcrR family transcriptional regulator
LPSLDPTPRPTPLSRSRWAGVPAEERLAERRALLLDAAFDLLGTEGDAATTVRAVCQRARLNPRYFYESFADRDALLLAVYDQQAMRLGEIVVANVEAAGDDEPARLRAGIETIARFVTDDPRRARVLYSEALGNEALNRRRLDAQHAVVDFLVQWDRERHGPPPTGEQLPTVMASILVGGLGELMLAWLDGRIDLSLDQLVDDASALFLATGEAAARLVQGRRS